MRVIIEKMNDQPPSIPLADLRTDRQSKTRQRRRAAKARLEAAKDILALLDHGKEIDERKK